MSAYADITDKIKVDCLRNLPVFAIRFAACSYGCPFNIHVPTHASMLRHMAAVRDFYSK